MVAEKWGRWILAIMVYQLLDTIQQKKEIDKKRKISTFRVQS